MAKMFITGSARSPSTEEFKARIARLAEMPTHTAAPANARKNRPAKPAFSQAPLRRTPEGEDGRAQDASPEDRADGPADDATDEDATDEKD
ncbi:hypothetical protein [Methylobacterium platani]|uniref:Uncharacterized protein n=2 Tax=Methylobacterium platani TaxID=427683 RepID=A0A179SCD6_9HYPH|nr:hypothetical protein [Methylobacterium platani]KMO20481.1 hypothetical protein SQ03_05540 [Methylobacterium platani JCM 14648]OAS25305.1 hypothetical protein A5481_10355 [Methylobacterium platani]